jgi:NAD(P)-dependent dehydrogenase (short-subunit alcohol dehydrogenase family)
MTALSPSEPVPGAEEELSPRQRDVLDFISSTLARKPVVTSAAYSAAKAGLLQVVKVLGLSGAPRRVRTCKAASAGRFNKRGKGY